MLFVNIPVLDFTGCLFIISLSAGSKASASAGSESVTRFIHKMCIGNKGSIKPIVIPNLFAKYGVNNIAKIVPQLLQHY